MVQQNYTLYQRSRDRIGEANCVNTRLCVLREVRHTLSEWEQGLVTAASDASLANKESLTAETPDSASAK